MDVGPQRVRIRLQPLYSMSFMKRLARALKARLFFWRRS
jgi:hypothetical protein